MHIQQALGVGLPGPPSAEGVLLPAHLADLLGKGGETERQALAVEGMLLYLSLISSKNWTGTAAGAGVGQGGRRGEAVWQGSSSQSMNTGAASGSPDLWLGPPAGSPCPHPTPPSLLSLSSKLWK